MALHRPLWAYGGCGLWPIAQAGGPAALPWRGSAGCGAGIVVFLRPKQQPVVIRCSAVGQCLQTIVPVAGSLLKYPN